MGAVLPVHVVLVAANVLRATRTAVPFREEHFRELALLVSNRLVAVELKAHVAVLMAPARLKPYQYASQSTDNTLATV